ncbi:type VII secretion protein EccB [Mycobacterium sp. 236(2023)]|uniref:type VII secretion protein EccB n=1 Tax=Mycobacterium sp. 236(2023) TaxID=3038163 RepID=UPI00241533EC|nr:type VII secretion protein EccB [Mycobacterium sp. 236(2023)]MDG4664012.1 type VII secretion protein EccB [Mycobacterium sp. 236(2023)]
MAQPTTRLEVSGHRFMARRMDHALVRGDTRMLDDPLRAQSLSLVAGAVLAVIGVAVCAVLAFIRPGGEVGDAPIVVVRESGAMFVSVEDMLHPVFNLASARLIVGQAAQPRVVSQRAVDRVERGPMMGIPVAPDQISTPLAAEDAHWLVCDDQDGSTSVIAGPVTPDGVGPGRSVLVTPRGESAAITYLLYGGWRARVDLRHAAVVRALRIDGVVPQPVSPSVLAAIPEAPAIEPPRIAELGTAGIVGDHPVGTVLRSGDDLFVVLVDGLQRIGQVAADLIRYTDARAGAEIPTLSGDAVGAVPVVTTLPVTTYPQSAGVTTEPVICAQWDHDVTEGRSHTRVLVGEQIPRVAASVVLAQADGEGPAVDSVAVPTGRSVFVRSVALTGDGRTSGSLFLVADTGVRYGIRDDESAAALGLADVPAPAPWPVLAVLPRGPELSRGGASVVRDGLDAAP